jgi:hypothetical protein
MYVYFTFGILFILIYLKLQKKTQYNKINTLKSKTNYKVKTYYLKKRKKTKKEKMKKPILKKIRKNYLFGSQN